MKKILCAFLAVVFLAASALCGCAFSEDGKEIDGVIPPDALEYGEYDYNVVRVDETFGEMNIYGKIYIPVTELALNPAVILSHSAGLTSDNMRSYCIGFASRGYVAYAFDFCGGSQNSRSDGNQEDMTVFSEVDDLKAVLNAVSALEFVDPEQIYLLGTSQGGLVSALAANDCPTLVNGLILLYPAFNIPELAALSTEYGGFSSGGSATAGFPTVSVGEAFTETLKDFDVYEHIGDFKGRVLIIHGSNDFIVPYSYSQRAAEVYENCEVRIINGASHGFNSENYAFFGNYDAEVWGFMDEFLDCPDDDGQDGA